MKTLRKMESGALEPTLYFGNGDIENKQTWKWRDRRGEFHEPRKMRTRHLFYTLRMIWNHTMPEEVKLHPYDRYEFSGFYTNKYMKEAIRRIGSELLGRTDILPSWADDLRFMARIVSPCSFSIAKVEDAHQS